MSKTKRHRNIIWLVVDKELRQKIKEYGEKHHIKTMTQTIRSLLWKVFETLEGGE